jgi:hypothetical protein
MYKLSTEIIYRSPYLFQNPSHNSTFNQSFLLSHSNTWNLSQLCIVQISPRKHHFMCIQRLLCSYNFLKLCDSIFWQEHMIRICTASDPKILYIFLWPLILKPWVFPFLIVKTCMNTSSKITASTLSKLKLVKIQ